MEEYVVKSSSYKKILNSIIQMRSRVEAYGNLVFTHAILSCFQTNGHIHEKMISQSFIGAYMRSVCVRTEAQPSIVVYSPCPDSEQYLQASSGTVTSMMKTFDSSLGWTETFNQAVRQYTTSLHNNIFIHFQQWQRSLIRWELKQVPGLSKGLRSYLSSYIMTTVIIPLNDPVHPSIEM
jgi:hypothetical protein